MTTDHRTPEDAAREEAARAARAAQAKAVKRASVARRVIDWIWRAAKWIAPVVVFAVVVGGCASIGRPLDLERVANLKGAGPAELVAWFGEPTATLEADAPCSSRWVWAYAYATEERAHGCALVVDLTPGGAFCVSAFTCEAPATEVSP